MKKRHLKVRETHRDYFLKDMGNKSNPTTPFIFKGTWLKEAGFTTGRSVSVHVT